MKTQDTRDAALHERMRTLVRDQSQARIARATSRSRTSLTRYLQGAKLPLEFGVALVEEFGVNPAWLLTGEEPVYLADVPAASSELGNDLLEMMRSMDHVSKLKLGALTGKGHARALRDVSEMLDRYGSLRDRLNRMSAPILSDLITQAELATTERRLDRARALERVASRIERFCDDRDLSNRLLSVRAYIFQSDLMIDQAAELRSHAFHACLTLDADFATIARPALGLAQALHTNQFCARARRVCSIAMSYAGPNERTLPPYIRLLSQEIALRVDLGDFESLAESVEQLVTISAGNEEREYADTMKLYYNLHRGIWRPEELAGADTPTFSGAAMLLNVCFVTDDADVIERALRRARSMMNPQMVLQRYHVGRGEDVLNALRGRPIPEQTIEERLSGRRTAELGLSQAVNRAHLLRLTGDSRAADVMLHAQSRLEELQAEQTPLPVMLALHLKNVLSSIPKAARNRRHRALRDKAETLCRERIARGYGLLRMLLD